MKIEDNKSLQEYTTFAVDVHAKHFAVVNNASELRDLITHDLWQEQPHYILGLGSNILFTKDYEGIIVFNNIKGFEILEEDQSSVTVKACAAENWHDLVMWAVNKNLWGIENLALIPGTVGASPVQNIGAYGVEAKDTIVSVDVIDLGTGRGLTLSNQDCKFEYRGSIFKKESNYFVTAVTFRLSKIRQPQLSYGSIVTELAEEGIEYPEVLDVAHAVIAIRQSKLPDVGEIGMGGSFFKNPVITREHAEQLRVQYPDMRSFDLPDENVKVPAGWLIEKLGYKGVQEGNVGTYHKHALVLVNHGNATGSEVWNFAQKIMSHVQQTFNINLEPEVIIK
jgi:UDP-N-acetylmuramate dehydrogenase